MNMRLLGGMVAAAGVAVLLLYAGVRSMWLAPRSALLEQRAELREQVDRLVESRERLREVDERVGKLVASTLGGDMQTVDHRLRTRLNRLAEETGVASAVVSTIGHAVKLSPARASMPRGGEWARLRDEPDFAELGASISGDGTLAQILELIDRIEAEPWVKRIDSVRVEPRDGGTVFGVTLRLTSIYIPSRVPEELDSPPWDPARLARLQPIIDGNPFRVPSPPPAPPPTVQVAQPNPRPAPPPPPPPAFPWGDWVLTGVASHGVQAEAWIRNRKSGEARRLGRGDALDAAELLEVEGDTARFRMPGGMVRIEIGQSFADRTPVPGA